MRALASGTSNSHQRVKPDELLNASIVLPDECSREAYGRLATPLLTKFQKNLLERQTLSELRDLLLRALFGQIDGSQERQSCFTRFCEHL